MADTAPPQTAKTGAPGSAPVSYDTHPERYAHWKLAFDGPLATLTMDVDEDGGIRPGYKLKLNSYDLGVDIELADALQRIRFEHPEVRCVILTSGMERVFCSGANIFMLGMSSHAWKVNFCKFTNETRNGIEDASRHSGLKFVAACNGTTAGGGYELALACDEIILIDDRSSAVSLPEVPLLGVLPGTGGLTRLTDKRHVRRDHADVFCTLAEGVRAERAREWRLIDDHAKPQQFAQRVKERALALAEASDRPRNATGVLLPPLARTVDRAGYRYEHVDVTIDRTARHATITVRAPGVPAPEDIDSIVAAGASWWPLAMARELDDAILRLRTNELDVGTWIVKTEGAADRVLAADAVLERHRSHWFVRETIGMLRRTLAPPRRDVAHADCADRARLVLRRDAARARARRRSQLHAGAARTTTRRRHGSRFPLRTSAHTRWRTERHAWPRGSTMSPSRLRRARGAIGVELAAGKAIELGLVTVAPDELDWADEVRIALEERASLSPDALTGMEANLRFGGAETMETRIFGRLSAWQNWIFVRPNAVGETGALKVFGTGNKARFDRERV